MSRNYWNLGIFHSLIPGEPDFIVGLYCLAQKIASLQTVFFSELHREVLSQPSPLVSKGICSTVSRGVAFVRWGAPFRLRLPASPGSMRVCNPILSFILWGYLCQADEATRETHRELRETEDFLPFHQKADLNSPCVAWLSRKKAKFSKPRIPVLNVDISPV